MTWTEWYLGERQRRAPWTALLLLTAAVLWASYTAAHAWQVLHRRLY